MKKGLQAKSIYRTDAIRLLEDGERHTLKVWELKTGEELTYRDVRVTGGFTRRGVHRVRFPESGEIRALRDVTLHEIDGLTIYY